MDKSCFRQAIRELEGVKQLMQEYRNDITEDMIGEERQY
jgi:hypothetical protein